ncbi:hypothetical protein [Streptomyces roseolilacinus]|uniref:hypothetical protein n=1 Tax=Streptomyces roseolilacinus TaxID=66904 RepID=UPI003818F2FF
MTLSEVPVPVLWLVALACTAAFAVTWGSWMTGKMRRGVYAMVLAMAVFGAATYYARDMQPWEVLSMYSLAMLALTLGVLGRRGELARLAEDVKRNPKSPDNKMSTGATTQLLVAVFVVAGVGTWFMR